MFIQLIVKAPATSSELQTSCLLSLLARVFRLMMLYTGLRRMSRVANVSLFTLTVLKLRQVVAMAGLNFGARI